jgi:hypothetical protein
MKIKSPFRYYLRYTYSKPLPTSGLRTWKTGRLAKRLLKRRLIYKLNSVAFSPQANYTDRATAACRRSQCQLLRI